MISMSLLSALSSMTNFIEFGLNVKIIA